MFAHCSESSHLFERHGIVGYVPLPDHFDPLRQSYVLFILMLCAWQRTRYQNHRNDPEEPHTRHLLTWIRTHGYAYSGCQHSSAHSFTFGTDVDPFPWESCAGGFWPYPQKLYHPESRTYGRLQAEDRLRQPFSLFSCSACSRSFWNPSSVLSKNIPLYNTEPVGVPKNALCLIFAMSNPTTKYSVEPRISLLNWQLLKPATIYIIHRNLLSLEFSSSHKLILSRRFLLLVDYIKIFSLLYWSVHLFLW